jgi:alpha-beta hydrolase superfamily lysophospholipase
MPAISFATSSSAKSKSEASYNYSKTYNTMKQILKQVAGLRKVAATIPAKGKRHQILNKCDRIELQVLRRLRKEAQL